MVVTGEEAPPDSETRLIVSDLMLAVNRMTPSRFQVPPVLEAPAVFDDGASARVSGGPPDTAIFFSFAPAKKPTYWLSGDQNAWLAPSVPGSARAVGESMERIHSCTPDPPAVAAPTPA